MTKELQSSRYIVISFLVREMGIDIVEAISLMAELEKSGICHVLSWSWSGLCNCAFYRNQWIFFSSGKSDKWFWTVRLSLPDL